MKAPHKPNKPHIEYGLIPACLLPIGKSTSAFLQLWQAKNTVFSVQKTNSLEADQEMISASKNPM